MNTPQKRTARSIAMSAALLTGTGLVAAAVPAEAAAPAVVTPASTHALRAKAMSAPVIVLRTGTVSARARVSAAPKLAISTKKAKKKHRSRRS